MIPQTILTQIADEMTISKGTTKTITGGSDDSSFILKIACDRKGFFSFVFGALTTPDGCYDLVQMIEKELLLNNVLTT